MKVHVISKKSKTPVAQERQEKTMAERRHLFACTNSTRFRLLLSSSPWTIVVVVVVIIINSSAMLLLPVAQGFPTTVVSRQQQHQQHFVSSSTSSLTPDSQAAARVRRRQQSVLLWLGAFSDQDNEHKRRNGMQQRQRQGQRQGRDDDDDDESSNDDLSSSSSSSYLATCIPGISSALARELIDLGCRNVQIAGPSAVRFTATTSTALVALLWARTPHKIMQRLFAAQQPDDSVIYNRNDLYNCIRDNVNVKDLLGNGHGGLLSLSVNVMFLNNNQQNAAAIPSDINHSHFTALTIKNALCDAVRDLRGGDDRPNVDLDDPDVPLVAVLRGCTTRDNQDGSSASRGGGAPGRGAQLSLYRQLHNGSLHRRGYRQEGKAIHKAAMKESLAAGLLLEAEWDKICQDFKQRQQPESENKKKQPQQRLVLVDPMAGSGTLLLEGAIMAADIAPHLMRIKCGLTPGRKSQTYPPVVRWKHHTHGSGSDENGGVLDEWKRLLQDATVRAKTGLAWLTTATSSSSMQLMANDWHPGALDLLQSALQEAGLADGGIVKVSQLNCRDFQPCLTAAQEAPSEHVKVMVVTNPPWGVRLGRGAKVQNDNGNSNTHDDEVEEEYEEDETLHDSWEALRVFLRQVCPPGKTEAWVLSGNKKSTKHLGLRRSKSIPIKVGQHDLRWIQYDILDQETKMAIMASKQQQQAQRREENDIQQQQQHRRPLGVYSQNEEIQASTKSTRQPWKHDQQEGTVERRQKAVTTSATSPQPYLSQPKRRVVQSRQKAVSDENEWLLD
jgi:putative N6-adenine-specific DNA methylase